MGNACKNKDFKPVSGVQNHLFIKIFQGKIEPLREPKVFLQGLGKIGEERRHLRGVLEMAFAVEAQAASGGRPSGILPRSMPPSISRST